MIALDANVLLEVLEERRYYTNSVRALEQREGRSETLAVSTLTVSITFYLAEKHKVPVSRVESLIKYYKIFDVLAADVDWAFEHYRGQDFEDALQVAAALREECTTFMTLDRLLAKKYSKFLNVELIGA